MKKTTAHQHHANGIKIGLLFLLMVIIGLGTKAQAKDSAIAPQTFFTELKASIKIETSNETIYNKLVKLPFKSIRKSDKTDRNGEYVSYFFYFKKEDIQLIRNFIAKL